MDWPNCSWASPIAWKTLKVLRFSSVRSTLAGARGRWPESSLDEERVALFGGEVRVGLVEFAGGVEEFAEHGMVGFGVLAHVHGGELEAEGGDGADDAVEDALGGELAALAGEGVAHDLEVGLELAAVGVVEAGPVREAFGVTGAGVREFRLDGAGLEPVGLFGVYALVAGGNDRAEALEVGRDGVEEFLGGGAHGLGYGELVDECGHRAFGGGDAVLVLHEQDLLGDLGGDEGVAVAVAADPGAELEGRGAGAGGAAEVGEGGVEVGEDAGGGVAVEVGEVVDRVAGLIGGLGLFDAEFVGLPEEVDDLGEAGVDGVDVGGAEDGALGGLGVEEVGDVAEFDEDGAAGGLGGVCGEDGAHFEAVGGGGDLRGGDVLGGDLGAGL